jgi:hypothetical protein
LKTAVAWLKYSKSPQENPANGRPTAAEAIGRFLGKLSESPLPAGADPLLDR